MERFWEKVDIKGPDECWLWKSEHSHHPQTGRGTFRPGGSAAKVPAPRMAFFLQHGFWPTVARKHILQQFILGRWLDAMFLTLQEKFSTGFPVELKSNESVLTLYEFIGADLRA